ncbi:MAG: ATP-binding cassette domain-containing protein [Chloroflexi bacterium]|nr:ATP-binding cassette domain-containing protein [Chloroflexota bacterium]
MDKHSTPIVFNHVSKTYGHLGYLSTLSGAVNQGLQLVSLAARLRAKRPKPVPSLNDVSFSVRRGEAFGVIGPNGAGKSTILRMAAGVSRPTDGTVKVSGKVAALLELGSGFHPELSGRANVFLYGVILGMSRQEVADRFDSIVAFAELQDHLDIPVKYYSAGMYMRLAFATAAHADADVLLIDEVLAVGDASFRAKCSRYIQQFLENGGSILLVSHDLTAINSLCKESMLLVGGSVRQQGRSMDVLHRYLTGAVSVEGGEAAATGDTPTSGDLQPLELFNVQLLNELGQAQQAFFRGDSLIVSFDYLSRHPVTNPMIGVAIVNENNVLCLGSNSVWDGVELGRLQGRGTVQLRFDNVSLLSGHYTVSLSVADSSGLVTWQWIAHAGSFDLHQGDLAAAGITWSHSSAADGGEPSEPHMPTNSLHHM